MKCKNLDVVGVHTLLTQDVIWRVCIWTSIQRFFNVIDVRLTSKQRCVLTGYTKASRKVIYTKPETWGEQNTKCKKNKVDRVGSLVQHCHNF